MPQEQQLPVATIAYEELSHSGTNLSDFAYQELLAVASRVIHARRNQAIVVDLDLGHDAAETLLHTCVETNALARVVQDATDADSFTRKFSVTLRNVLIDLARATPAGALARRVVDTLRREGRFERIPAGDNEGKWCTTAASHQPVRDSLSAPRTGDRMSLVEAACSIDIAPYSEWLGSRRTPVCTDAELISVISVIVDAADGAVELSEVIYAVKHRFGFLGGSMSLVEPVPHAATSGSAETYAIESIDVQEVVAGLSHEEKAILQSYLEGLTVRELAARLGCSPSTAATKRRAMKSMLEGLGWTSGGGSPSNTNTRETSADEETQ